MAPSARPVPCGRDARAAAPKGGRRTALALAALLGALTVALAASQALTAFVAPQVSAVAHTTRHLRDVARFAEEGDVAVAEPPADEEVAEPAAEDAKAPAAPQPLFQELKITNRTTPKGLMGAMVAIFNRGERAVDLVLIDPRAKHTPMYAIAQIPENFQASASVQMRRRDRRLRIRVYQQLRPEADAEPEVFRVSKSTNATKLGNAIKSKFVDYAGNNLQRTVRLEFQGKPTAAQALLAIENAGRLAYRELAFMPKFVEREMQPAEPADGEEEGDEAPAEAAAPTKQVYVRVEVSVF